jgi:hypothetical protein
MPFDCTSERSISTVVVLGNTVAGTARSDSPPEPSLKLSGNPPSKLVMAVGSCTRISSIFGVLIKNYTVVVKKRFFDATEQNQNKKPTSRCNTIRHTTKAYILLKRESAVSGSNRRERKLQNRERNWILAVSGSNRREREKIAKQRNTLDLSSQRQRQKRENCKTERESRSFATSYKDVDSKRRRRTTTTTTNS